ncbi:MAG: hypothetical protein GY737_30605 [Desulfobacteraceae bacterium]|nr:hypothetical protein [Desulfobacteraceae bacterium]
MPSRPIILPVLKKAVEPTVPISGELAINEKRRRLNIRSKRRLRKRQPERREEVRDGVIVTLSQYNDRRKKPDRRKKTNNQRAQSFYDIQQYYQRMKKSPRLDLAPPV